MLGISRPKISWTMPSFRWVGVPPLLCRSGGAGMTSIDLLRRVRLNIPNEVQVCMWGCPRDTKHPDSLIWTMTPRHWPASHRGSCGKGQRNTGHGHATDPSPKSFMVYGSRWILTPPPGGEVRRGVPHAQAQNPPSGLPKARIWVKVIAAGSFQNRMPKVRQPSPKDVEMGVLEFCR